MDQNVFSVRLSDNKDNPFFSGDLTFQMFLGGGRGNDLLFQNLAEKHKDKKYKPLYFLNIKGGDELMKFRNFVGFSHPLKKEKLEGRLAP